MTPTPQVAETPLPLKQMFVLALVLLNESLCSTMLLPYVGFLIAHLQNRPAEESGYISGVLIGVFMLGQVVTAKYWGRMSDKYGRRVPLLIGLLSSGFMMLGFGLSTHVWNCIVFRFFHGFFNGNVFVAKTILADILDKTNESKGFVLVSLTYGFGTLLGPALGGLLYDPANSKSMQWAGFSKNGVFAQFPGLLPALAVLMYTNFAAFMCIVFLYESNKNAQPLPWWLRLCLPCLSREQHVALPSSDSISDLASERKRQVKKYSSDEKKDREIAVGVEPLAFEEKNDAVSVINSMERLGLEEVEMEEEEEESYEEREGIRMNGGGGGSNGAAFDNTDVNTFGYKEAFLLPITRRVLVIYMFLCAADVTYAEIFPLWVIAKESVGGLNYHSDVLGLFLLSNSFPCVMSNLLFHVAYRLIPDRMTLWRIAVFGMALAVAVIPFASYAPRTGQLILILVCSFTRQWFAVWAFNLITVLTAHVAPSGCVGTMYGIGQSCGASMRGLVPVMVTPLFAWSISGRNIPPFDHMFVFLLASVVFIIGGFFSYGIKTDEDVATEIVIEEEEEEEEEYIFHEERNSTNAHNQAFLWQQCEEEEEKGDQQRGKG